jgi:hypothetical protein
METNSALNQTKEYLYQKEIEKDIPPLFNQSIQHNTEESLESLAQQREKILG